VVETVFPRTEIATMTTFQVQPTGDARAIIDASSGTVPLPSNLLLDGTTLPDDSFAPATSARVANLPSSFGALAPGFATLDGFSTTALLLIPTSGVVLAATATGADATIPTTSTFTNNVFLFDLTDPRNPVLVNPAAYDELLPAQALGAAAPRAFAAPLIGLQPASAAKPGTVPLKDATEYAVIVTNRIKSLPNQTPLARSSVANIILFNNPLYANGQSLLAGVPAAQAKILERMRAQIANVLPKLAALPSPQTTTKADIALAYTFRTQTITTPAVQLAAAPYADPTKSAQIVPIDSFTVVLTPTDAFRKYGVDPTVVPGTGATDFIDEVIETAFPTSNLLSGTTGAFDPALLTPTASPPIEVVKTLIVVPKVAQVIACPNPPFPAGARCAPLVVFHHGLNGSRGQMLLGANALAQKGFVVAAIDAPKHGSRSWCTADTDCVAPPGGTANGGPPVCTPIPGGANQGDPVPPGTCTNGSVPATGPVLCTTAACVGDPGRTDGVALKSGTFVISGNLFRTRDTFRQDIFDNSGLILALARPPPSPALPGTPSNIVTTLLGAKNIFIRPDQVYWEGQSLGGILGTLNVAANSRISEAVLNVPGGTFVDIAVTSPAFALAIGSVLGSIPPPIGPIDPVANPAAFLQFIQVAKWAFDPADPINFGGHLLGGPAHPTLPDPLNNNAPQAAKKVLGQFAACDAVVPNAWNALLFNVIGLGPIDATHSTAALYANAGHAGAACKLGVTPNPGTAHHGFLLDWGVTATGIDPNDTALTVAGQTDAANFLASPATLPPPLVTKP
jgi:dienelactone hydrolase